MWDGTGRTRWTYDQRGRVVTEEKWIDGQLYTTQWAYDAMDRILTRTYPDGDVVSYTYNDQLLLAGMSGSVSGGIASDLAYNALDLPSQIKLSNATNPDPTLYLRYRYYGVDYTTAHYGTLWDIKLESGSGPDLLFRLEHGYDSVLNVVQTVLNRDVLGATIEDMSFDYDPLDRLSDRRETYGDTQETFTYDNIGNIASKNGASYTYHATKKHAVISDGSQSYDYDANGNMIQRGTSQYLKYDAQNRLVKVSSDSNGLVYVARMAYDGDGRRVKRVDNNGTIHYIGPHYERNVGTGLSPSDIVTKYYYAQMGKMKRLVALKKDTDFRYIIPDHLGGTLSARDNQGNLPDAGNDIRYHSFGATRSGGTSLPTDKRFTGQSLDQSTGLYDYGARCYDCWDASRNRIALCRILAIRRA